MSERLPPGFVLDPVKPPVRGLKGMEKVEPKTPSNPVKKTALRGVAEPALPEAVTPAPEGMLARAGWADRQGLQGMLGGLRAGCADAPWTALLQDAAHGSSYRPVDESCARNHPDYVTPHPPLKRFSNARGWRDMETAWTQDAQRQVIRQGVAAFKEDGAPLYEIGPVVTSGQGRFDALIMESLRPYPDIDPLIYKSLLFQESKMEPKRTNPQGFAGVAQLGKRTAIDEAKLSVGATAKRNGKWEYDPKDQRFDPEKAIPGAAKVLSMKMRDIDRYLQKKGIQDQYSSEEKWQFYLAAYNAGQGTVTRTIEMAIQAGVPAPTWDDLIAGNPTESHLWKGMGTLRSAQKYQEISKFPREVLARFHEEK